MKSVSIVALFFVSSVSAIARNEAKDAPLAACLTLNQTFATQLANGQFSEGEAALSAALRADHADDSCPALTLNNMAGLLSALGRVAEAERLAERSVAMLEKSPNDAVLLRSLQILATIRFEQGKMARARAAFRRMQSIPISGPGDSALVHGTAAAFLQAENRLPEAEAEYIAALRAWGEAGRGDRADAAAILEALASLYIKEQRLDEAGRTLDRSLAIFSRAKDTAPMDRIKMFNLRAAVHARLGHWQQCEQYLGEALSIIDRQRSADPAVVRTVLGNYSYALRRNHHRREAESIEARAATLPANRTPAALVDVTDLLVEAKAVKK
jgi:tetratricopeptide (TPR) repeat protein